VVRMDVLCYISLQWNLLCDRKIKQNVVVLVAVDVIVFGVPLLGRNDLCINVKVFFCGAQYYIYKVHIIK